MPEAIVEAAKRTDSLVGAVQGFLRAETWEASRAIVAAEPRLLSEDAVNLLSQLAERAHKEGDARSARLFEQHRAILERARSIGVDQAFAELVVTTAPLDLGAILAKLAEIPEGPSELPLRIELSRQALAQAPREADPELWALLESTLGTSLLMSPIGDRSANLEKAILALEDAAVALRDLDVPGDAGRTLNNLGLALESRWEGVPDDNLERAIAAYEEACNCFAKAEMRYEWAQAINNLANVYGRRARGGRVQNLERAIGLYREALAILSQESEPRPVLGDEVVLPVVRVRLNLGIALMERFEGDRSQNLESAATEFRRALEVINPLTDPETWSHLQVNLANALTRQAKVTGDEDYFERALIAYESALQVYQETNSSVGRGLTLSNLANTLRARPGGPSDADTERAIAAYEEAVELLDREQHTRDWALAWNNLGEAYVDQPGIEPAERFERAITAFQQAAEALDERIAPIEYAQVMKNLGSAYRRRVEGDKAENLSVALHCYENALRIRSEVYGTDHPRTGSVLYSIAKVHAAAGDYRAARTSLERALRIDEATDGEPPRRLPRRYRLLADTQMRLDDTQAAEDAAKRALALDEEIYGPDHPDVFTDLRLLASIYQADGRYAEAAGALGSAVALESLGQGEAPGGVRASLASLAELLAKAGDLAAAERTMERAVRVDEKLFGPEHPRVAESLVKLAKLLSDARDVTRAHETLERARKIDERSRGRMPPRMASTIATLSGLIDEARAGRVALDVIRSPGRISTPVRVTFSETLRGYLRPRVADPIDDDIGGREAGKSITLRLDVVVEDLDRLLSDGGPPASVAGTVECALLGGAVPIREGTYAVRRFGENPEARHVDYRLELITQQGTVHLLRGERTIDPHSDNFLREALSMRLWVEGAADTSAAGVASIRHLDLINGLESIRVEVPTDDARPILLERFGDAFFGPLWEFYESRPPGLPASSQDTT